VESKKTKQKCRKKRLKSHFAHRPCSFDEPDTGAARSSALLVTSRGMAGYSLFFSGVSRQREFKNTQKRYRKKKAVTFWLRESGLPARVKF
jgi:hypothetical protein